MSKILIDLFKGEKIFRPPIWFMRQAGRVLPSYQTLKKRYNFKYLMDTPHLAAEVTLLPLNDLSVDAAILFSDILVIPEALGMKLSFMPKPRFNTPLAKVDDYKNFLKPNSKILTKVYQAIDIVKNKIPDDKALIGFSGSPFTVLCYMYEGVGGDHTFSTFLNDFYNYPKKMTYLLEQITEQTIEYAINQVKHGIDVFQIFDTHAGIISFDFYEKYILPFIIRILNKVRQLGIPTIYFPKGIGLGLRKITFDITDALSIDWQTPINAVRQVVDNELIIQGNFNPRILLSNKSIIDREIDKYIEFGRKETKWIFNLGHGFIPETHIDNINYLVNRLKSANWKRT